jgi:ABC-type multidrug transport system ATPase subunit
MKQLKFENISFGYKKNKQVFRDLTFDIGQKAGRGFVVALMGSSGSGKSTILKLILGIEKNYSGKITISPSNPVISYVPQEPVLFEHLTPLENAEYLLKVGNYKSKFDKELFSEITKTLQIEEVLNNAKSVNEISGGQKQKISLLRALSIKPDILLLDEPLTGLDEEVKDQFLQTLATIIDKYKLMVIYVTHHRKEAEFISDVVAYLDNDKTNDSNTHVKISFTKEFFNKPPTVSALNAIKEIRVNTLQFELQEGGAIKPIGFSWHLPGKNVYLMSFQDEIINFSDNVGLEYAKVAETGSYAILKLDNADIPLTIDLETLKEKNYLGKGRLYLEGKVNIYDNYGQFLKTAEIKDNIIYKLKE